MKPIPTLVELYNNLENDFRDKLDMSDDNLKKTLNAFNAVISGELKNLYLFLANIQNNVFPDTADTEEQGGTLNRLGNIYLNRPAFPSTVGVFKIRVNGVIGSVLRTDLTFKSNDDALNTAQLYVLDGVHTMLTTSDIIEVRSLGSGSSFNLNVGDRLTITEPIVGIDKTVVVTEVFTEPKEGESIESYRNAILLAIQLERQGGSKSDYRQWASDVQGVRLVYPYVSDGNAGEIDIYVEATLENSIAGTGVPTLTMLEDVKEVIEQDPDETKPVNERGRRPLQAIVNTIPINRIPVDIVVSGLNNNTVAVQNSIRDSIEAFLYDVRPFINGADLLRNQNDFLFSGKIQGVVTDTLINGNFFNFLTLSVNGNVVVSYQFDLGNVPYLRNLTF